MEIWYVFALDRAAGAAHQLGQDPAVPRVPRGLVGGGDPARAAARQGAGRAREGHRQHPRRVARHRLHRRHVRQARGQQRRRAEDRHGADARVRREEPHLGADVHRLPGGHPAVLQRGLRAAGAAGVLGGAADQGAAYLPRHPAVRVAVGDARLPAAAPGAHRHAAACSARTSARRCSTASSWRCRR